MGGRCSVSLSPLAHPLGSLVNEGLSGKLIGESSYGARREGVPGDREGFPEEDALLSREDSVSDGIYRAVISTTFPVSRQLRDVEDFELS